jgi:phloretin hydrolase
MDVYEFNHIPELTEEEKKSPYARFYNEPILPPDLEVLGAIQTGNQINPSRVLLPEDIGKLFISGSMRMDNGYCLLGDGTGFSRVHTWEPGVTPEMEEWWGTWFRSSEYNYVNYKIWMPSLHFSHGNPIWEDLGWGPCKLYMVKPIKAEDLNLPASPKKLNPDFLSLGGGAFKIVPDAGGSIYYATLVHYVTIDTHGIDVVTHVWSGIYIIDGKPIRMIEKGERVNLEYVRLFACHNAWEFARKVQLLPVLYAFSKTL